MWVICRDGGIGPVVKGKDCGGERMRDFKVGSKTFSC